MKIMILASEISTLKIQATLFLSIILKKQGKVPQSLGKKRRVSRARELWTPSYLLSHPLNLGMLLMKRRLPRLIDS